MGRSNADGHGPCARHLTPHPSLEEGQIAYRFPGSWQFRRTDNFAQQSDNGFRLVCCPDVKFCPGCGYNPHVDSLVVAVDGACPNTQNGATKSASGVYFGDGEATKYNRIKRVLDSPNHPHTSQRAELHAAITALRDVEPFLPPTPCDAHKRECEHVHQIVIKLDSAYLVDGITEYVQKWDRNGWKNALNKPVANQDLWLLVIGLVEAIKARGTIVEFWHVRREMNTEADGLANLGLEKRG